MSASGKAVDTVSKCISNSFKQQAMVSWQPLYSSKTVIPALLILGIIFLPIGITSLLASNSIREVAVEYQNACPLGSSSCNIHVDLEKPLRAPVYMYYELDDYYQNYRMYAKSKNYDQLTGKWVGYSGLGECDPIRSENESRADEDVYYPCGLIAWSLFNDTFQILDGNGAVVPQSKKGISWRADREAYKNVPEEKMLGIPLVGDVEDEDFLVWMRSSAFPKFRKLYRRLEKDRLPNGELSGNITAAIRNNYPVTGFDNKRLILSETAWIGGKNPAIGIIYIVASVLMIVAAVVLLVAQLLHPRKYGDLSVVGLEEIDDDDEDEEGSGDEESKAGKKSKSDKKKKKSSSKK